MSVVEMALIALIASWLLSTFTLLDLFTMIELGESLRKMLLVIKNVSELDTKMLLGGKVTKVEDLIENVFTLSAAI